MGFKDDVRELGADLERRVTNLESAVGRLQDRSGAVTVETLLPTRTPGASLTDDLPREAVSTNTASRIDRRFALDYPAVAFGLSEIARKVKGQLGATTELTAYYRETVQYFADVFAKNDPEFNEAEFKRQAGA